MNPKHAAAFEAYLGEVTELYDRTPPSQEGLRIWWEALAPFDWPMVKQALAAHCAAVKFTPRPADILERLTTADGRPDPDEAWSLALLANDEAKTLIWTREIAEAWGIAQPVLDVDDRIGARKTFLAAYSRLVGDARRAMEPAAWTVSLGQDPTERVPALVSAIRQGRLTRQHARALLGPQDKATPGALECAKVIGLLSGKVTDLPNLADANARRYLAIVREGLARADDPAVTAKAAADLEREQARMRESERKAAAAAVLDALKAERSTAQESAT